MVKTKSSKCTWGMNTNLPEIHKVFQVNLMPLPLFCGAYIQIIDNSKRRPVIRSHFTTDSGWELQRVCELEFLCSQVCFACPVSMQDWSCTPGLIAWIWEWVVPGKRMAVILESKALLHTWTAYILPMCNWCKRDPKAACWSRLEPGCLLDCPSSPNQWTHVSRDIHRTIANLCRTASIN